MHAAKKKSIIEDIKTAGVIIGIITTVAAIILGLGRWFFDLQSKADAEIAHRVILEQVKIGDGLVKDDTEKAIAKQEKSLQHAIEQLSEDRKENSEKIDKINTRVFELWKDGRR